MKKSLAAAVICSTLFVSGQAVAMGGFEYYDQPPEKAWDKTRQALVKAAGPVFGYFEPGRGPGAEETSKRYVTRHFTITLPPGWSAKPGDDEYSSVVFFPRDKRIDIMMEVKRIESDLDLNGFTSRYAKWLETKEGLKGNKLLCRENTLDAAFPCCLIASSFDSEGERTFQVAKVVSNRGRIYIARCIADAPAWVSNFETFKDCLESFRPTPFRETTGMDVRSAR